MGWAFGPGGSRDGSFKRCTTIKFIQERTVKVEARHQGGHWEEDLIVSAGQRRVIASLVGRKMRLTMLSHWPTRTRPTCRRRTDRSVLTHSRTDATSPDLGPVRLDVAHLQSEHLTGLLICFVDPQPPWRRGSNEKVNGPSRHYFPKGTDLAVWTTEERDVVAAALIDRPRLCLTTWRGPQFMRRWERRLARTPILFVRWNVLALSGLTCQAVSPSAIWSVMFGDRLVGDWSRSWMRGGARCRGLSSRPRRGR